MPIHTKEELDQPLQLGDLIQERTPAQLTALLDKAGLKVRNFWDIRTSKGIIEAVLPGSNLLDYVGCFVG